MKRSRFDLRDSGKCISNSMVIIESLLTFTGAMEFSICKNSPVNSQEQSALNFNNVKLFCFNSSLYIIFFIILISITPTLSTVGTRF